MLEIINANDRLYSWYQLDRALTSQFGRDSHVVSIGLLAALHNLEESGLVTTQTGHRPSQPLYCMTETGQRTLGSSISDGRIG